MPRVIVLGTGTGVGKTYVSRALVRSLAARSGDGVAVGGLKPIESGVADDVNSDAALLAAMSRAPAMPEPRALYALAEPIAPWLAAARTGTAIELDPIAAWLTEWEARNVTSLHIWSIVETAGGALSPLTRELSNVDLAVRLSPAIWVLVAPDALGVLHDVRATLEALAARGYAVDEIVLSEARAPDASTGTNAGALRELGVGAPISVVRRGQADATALVDRLIAKAGL